jgi:hypothetical protein
MGMGSKIGGGLFAVVIASTVIAANNDTAKGWVFAHVLWDRESPFSCGGGWKVKLEGEDIELAEGNVVSAGGDCQLTLIDCTFKSPTPISAGGSAHVVIEGGRIEGTQMAISLGGNATAEVRGAEIVGDVDDDVVFLDEADG